MSAHDMAGMLPDIYCLITTNNSGPIFPEAKVEVIYIYTSMLI